MTFTKIELGMIADELTTKVEEYENFDNDGQGVSQEYVEELKAIIQKIDKKYFPKAK